MKSFRNEPLTDFTQKKPFNQMIQALAKVKQGLGQECSLIIAGNKIKSASQFNSFNPSRTSEVIGILQEASEDQAHLAIQSAWTAFESWRKVPAVKRAQYCFKMAAVIRKRKFEYASWLTYEVGKNWREADAEVAEAIDFLEYYGREMIRLSKSPRLIPIKNEKNELRYIPLGVGAIISPWNFSFAIMIGMTMSAVVTGNTVVVKPSEFGSTVAVQFMKLVEAVKLPHGVINLITGTGATAGKFLVTHPRIRFISFTGSKKVGLEITENAAKAAPGQKWIKKVITEMGGKDAIIVDEDANLESALNGVIKSAFGYQGQKCSACSRAIIHEKIYDRFTQALVEKVKTLKVAPPEEPDAALGPIISQPQFEKALSYIEIGKQEGILLTGGKPIPGNGYFLEPTIFADVSPTARLAQEEIFAPVLSIIKAKSFDDALQIANNTEYGLTGAVFTKNRKKIEKAKDLFHAGNFYINRGCTGAFVGAHPFGGFNMSGTDSKAGGPDYLMLFMQAKTISEVVE